MRQICMGVLDTFCGFVHTVWICTYLGLAEPSHNIKWAWFFFAKNSHPLSQRRVSLGSKSQACTPKNKCQKNVINSRSTVWFRSRALRVMSPARFRCATVLATATLNPYLKLITKYQYNMTNFLCDWWVSHPNILHPPCHVLAKIYIVMYVRTYLCTDSKF